MKKLVAAFMAFFWGALVNCKAAEAAPNEKPLAEIKKEVQEGKAILVDVREQTEWDFGHVKDAKLIPLSALKSDRSDLSALPKDKRIYTYCVMGKRASMAATILNDKGYKATPLKEGFGDLSKSGFDTTK